MYRPITPEEDTVSLNNAGINEHIHKTECIQARYTRICQSVPDTHEIYCGILSVKVNLIDSTYGQSSTLVVTKGT
jgi:hypothetical protein